MNPWTRKNTMKRWNRKYMMRMRKMMMGQRMNT
jgi:hypothetical protein